MHVQRRHFKSFEFRKQEKDAQCTESVEWGGGERGSMDNYKR
jgi:hypothetical protein